MSCAYELLAHSVISQSHGRNTQPALLAMSHWHAKEVPEGCMAVSMRLAKLDMLASWAARRTCRLSDGDAASCGGCQPSNQLQQRGLSSTAPPVDQAQLPGRDPEADVP